MLIVLLVHYFIVLELLPVTLFHDISCIRAEGKAAPQIQIDCLAAESVIVIFGGWINGPDGSWWLRRVGLTGEQERLVGAPGN